MIIIIFKMKISKYHLIQYVLKDESMLDNCETKMKEVSKIFRGKIPNALLYGLIAKNNEKLSSICHEYLLLNQAYEAKAEADLKAKHEKFERWQTQHKLNNEKAKLKKIQDAQIHAIKEQERAREYNQRYINQMKSTWDKQLNDVIEKRNREAFATVHPFQSDPKMP